MIQVELWLQKALHNTTVGCIPHYTDAPEREVAVGTAARDGDWLVICVVYRNPGPQRAVSTSTATQMD